MSNNDSSITGTFELGSLEQALSPGKFEFLAVFAGAALHVPVDANRTRAGGSWGANYAGAY
jgi:hypothetical protein